MLEQYFSDFRQHIIGQNLEHHIAGKNKNVLYADWTASGRLYQPIEEFISHKLGVFVANTHTETNLTGSTMTHAYHDAQQVIKRHVNANENDALICAGSGMTTVINKLQRILGLRVPENARRTEEIDEQLKPVVFVTHMEHHSNQTTWNTCDVNVVVLAKDEKGQPCLEDLQKQLNRYKSRPLKIGSFTACSNVTGIKTNYHQLAKVMHQNGGLCFVDFACSAPYVDIDMHPADPLTKLDAIFFSPHKFLGGPGSSGVLVFDKTLYTNTIPDQPGGGTVTWTNPWGQQGFYDDVEVREDGGTPGFLQTIKVALAIKLKEQMGVQNIHQREQQLVDILLPGLNDIDGIDVLEPEVSDRLCIVSFFSRNWHYNLIVRLLNDKFGIQARGGCSCAGTYGHILLDVDQDKSANITCKIDSGDLSEKPGWIRLSLHPTSTDEEAHSIVEAVAQIMKNIDTWSKEYEFDSLTGDFRSKQTTTEFFNIEQFEALPRVANTKPSWFKKVFSA